MSKNYRYPAEVEVLSNNGLTKEVYKFEMQGNTLRYVMYSKYERETVYHMFPDEWPAAISMEKWLAIHDPDWEEHYEGDCHPGYDKYYGSLMGTCQRTSDGRGLSAGAAGGNLASWHPVPPGVPERAKLDLIANMKVEGLDC